MINKIRYLIKHSSFYLLATIVQKASGFLILTFTTDTRYISIADYSAYNFFIMNSMIFGSIFSLGMESAIVRYLKMNPKKKSLIINTSIHILLVSVLVGLIAINIDRDFLAAVLLKDNRHSQMVFYIGIVVLFDILGTIPQYYYRADERPAIFTVIKIVRFIVELSCIYIGVRILNLGIYGAVYGLACSSLINFIIVLPFYFKHYRFEFSKELATQLLRFSLPLVPNAILYLLIEISDRYFLDAVNKNLQAAYTNMYKFGAFLTILNMAFRTAWQPIMLREYQEHQNKDYFNTVLIYFSILVSFVMLATVTMAPDFIRYNPIPWIRNLIRDPFYFSQIHLLGFILIGYVFLGIYYFFSLAFYITDSSRSFIIFTFFGLMINILLNSFIFVFPEHATLIAAIATMIAFFCMFYLAAKETSRIIQIPFEWSKIGTITLYLIICATLLFLYPDMPTYLKITFFLGFYPYCRLSSVLKKNDINQILHLFGKKNAT